MIILRSGVLPRWLGVTGLVVSALYLLNQGDILATAVPGFPVWDLAGLIGSTTWGLWVAALGVTLLVRPLRRSRRPATGAESNIPAAGTPTARPPPDKELSTMTASAAVRTSFLRTWLLWTAGFLAFPLAGSPVPRSPAASTARSLRCPAVPSPGWSSAPARRW